MLLGADHMTTTFMPLIIETIVVCISFHVVGVYLGHLQLMRCVWNFIINFLIFFCLVTKLQTSFSFYLKLQTSYDTHPLIVQVLFEFFISSNLIIIIFFLSQGIILVLYNDQCVFAPFPRVSFFFSHKSFLKYCISITFLVLLETLIFVNRKQRRGNKDDWSSPKRKHIRKQNLYSYVHPMANPNQNHSPLNWEHD